ncbi:hypothetical protein [Guptibacillus algicola]|uniref:hypothetical protein n=1 Tax=Guptibacillus algicola TaxID=225844 RepID=UPI001CD26AC2|nr:hypothetical protein [Alkalihalobacillus algicola]MCA0987127.1 hypothetical protein [Alkalihalobacillus algicola]
MNTKTLLTRLGWIGFASWILYFILTFIVEYPHKECEIDSMVGGVIFFLVVTPIYFVLVHLYFNDKQKMAMWSLVFLGLISIGMAVFLGITTDGETKCITY